MIGTFVNHLVQGSIYLSKLAYIGSRFCQFELDLDVSQFGAWATTAQDGCYNGFLGDCTGVQLAVPDYLPPIFPIIAINNLHQNRLLIKASKLERVLYLKLHLPSPQSLVPKPKINTSTKQCDPSGRELTYRSFVPD